MEKRVCSSLFVLTLLFAALFSFSACGSSGSSEAPKSVAANKKTSGVFEFGTTKDEMTAFVKGHLGDEFHIAYTTTLKNPLSGEIYDTDNISVIKTAKGYCFSRKNVELLYLESRDGFGYDSYLLSNGNAIRTGNLSKASYDEGIAGFIEEFATNYNHDIPLNMELIIREPDETYLGRICVKYVLYDTAWLIDKETGAMLNKADPVQDYECTIFKLTDVVLPSLPQNQYESLDL